jgi:hypothetical protein
VEGWLFCEELGSEERYNVAVLIGLFMLERRYGRKERVGV